MSRLLCAITSLVLALALIGCGGDDDGGGGGVPGPQPSADDAKLSGVIVAGDNVGTPLARVQVSEATTGQSTYSASDGSFRLEGLPAGTVSIVVDAPSSGHYLGTTLPVALRANLTTKATIALLPASAKAPTQLAINPSGTASVEQGGTIKFTASVYAAGTKIDVAPSWVLSSDTGDVGDNEISADGTLRSRSVGTYRVTGVIGRLTNSAGVEVTAASPPVISSLLLSASSDTPVPASGGVVTITAAISDGNGLQTNNSGGRQALRFEVRLPSGDREYLPLNSELPFLPIDGTTVYDGTWRYQYAVPANGNEPNSDGVQSPQTYSVRVVARDTTGAESTSDWQQFKVAGLEAPPPPPSTN